jgi:hypothetical protein
LNRTSGNYSFVSEMKICDVGSDKISVAD